MESTVVNIHAENGSVPEKVELVIREGEALKEREKKPYSVSGVITNPMEYCENHDLKECDTAMIEYNYEEGSIVLKTDYKNDLGDTISGNLKEPNYLKEFSINSGKKFSNKSLSEVIKKYRFLFPDTQQYTKLYNALKNFSAKIETVIEDSSNQRGKTKKLLEKSVESEIPEGFVIKTPLFIGEDQIEIKIDLFYEATDNNVEFFMESVDLILLKEEQAKVIIDRELELLPSNISKLQVY